MEWQPNCYGSVIVGVIQLSEPGQVLPPSGP